MRVRLHALILLFVLMSVFTVYGRPLDEPIASVEILRQPQRVVYDIGEDVDLYGLELKVTYISGYAETVGYADLTYSGYNPQQEGSQLIVVQYGEYSTPLAVTVKKGSLRSINVKLKQSGTWIEGRRLSKDDFVVTATYDVGSSREVTDYTFTPDVIVDGRNIITVTYQDKSSQVVIGGRKNMCQNIRIESPGTEEFNVGEPFNWNGLKVIGHFLDGSEVDVTSKCTVKGVPTGKVGTYYAEVSYESKIVTYPVEVVKYVFERADVSRWSTDKEVDVFFLNHEEPVVVDSANIKVTDDNTVGVRTYDITCYGNTYTVTSDIPEEERRYLGSRRILATVPVGIKLVPNSEGVLGYVPKTELKSSGDADINLYITLQKECDALSGLPVTINLKRNSSAYLTLDLKSIPWDAQMYYKINAKLEVPNG